MKFKWKSCGKIFLFYSFTFFYCEYFIYYLVINQCSWPVYPKEQGKSVSKVMFLADTHLLGPFRGHWFDKLRREWQMYRSFQSAVSIYQPEVVVILGDLFDEGQWCDKELFEDYVDRFFSLFKVPEGTELFVVPGNHDLGFHYALRPFLLKKFEYYFNTTSVQLINFKDNYFILINSMAMEGDNCYLCSDAEAKLKKIAWQLNCMKNKTCGENKNLKEYSRPIILQHFPMFRESDAKCNETDEAPPHIKNKSFKQKWDCLSEEASEMIYNELNPRAIFTGHSHHGCFTTHRKDIHEYTIPSFSWRNKNNPTFTLVVFTPQKYVTNKCDIPRESTVIFLYSSSILGSLMWIIYKLRKHSKCKKVFLIRRNPSMEFFELLRNQL